MIQLYVMLCDSSVKLCSSGGFSCNGVSCFGENVASVGDDGRVNVFNVNQQGALLREYPDADSCVLTSVLFSKVTNPFQSLQKKCIS